MKRKEALKKIIEPAPHLSVVEYVIAEGEQLFSAISKLGIEGMVAKKANSFYTGWQNERLVEDQNSGWQAGYEEKD
jgi:ATP-dependent DNA ligase